MTRAASDCNAHFLRVKSTPSTVHLVNDQAIPHGVTVTKQPMSDKETNMPNSNKPTVSEDQMGMAVARLERIIEIQRLMLMQMQGINRRSGYEYICFIPMLTRSPQEVCGDLIPMPIKLRKASEKIAPGIAKVMLTMITPIMLGIMCLKTMRFPSEPSAVAAST